jgi:hypothetical protein
MAFHRCKVFIKTCLLCLEIDRDFISLESKLTMVEKQMAEAKEMYDKITGQNQSVVCTE